MSLKMTPFNRSYMLHNFLPVCRCKYFILYRYNFVSEVWCAGNFNLSTTSFRCLSSAYGGRGSRFRPGSQQIHYLVCTDGSRLGPAALVDQPNPRCGLIMKVPFNGTLKQQTNVPLYSSSVIGTLAVDGWAVTFGTAPSPLMAVPNVIPHPWTAGVPTSYYSIRHCNYLISLKG